MFHTIKILNRQILQTFKATSRDCSHIRLQLLCRDHIRKICTTPKRFLLNTRLRRVGSSAEVERFLKQKDKIPEEYELIYRSIAGTYISAAKYSVIISSAAVASLALWQALSHGAYIHAPLPDLVYGGLVAKENDLYFFAAGFVAINLAFSAILRRYPLRIYRHLENYIACYESQIPFRSAQHHRFVRGTVKELQPLLNPWKDCYYKLGDRSSLLFSYYFKTPSEFNKMF